MSKNTTINLRVDKEVKEQASAILSSLGLTLSDAFNLMLHQVRITRGLPFEIKQRLPFELNDGHGSYICEFGYVHDYSKKDWDALERDGVSGPFYSMEELLADLNAEDDDDDEDEEI
jgi:addiction module RelB/DinJ family antitoxin